MTGGEAKTHIVVDMSTDRPAAEEKRGWLRMLEVWNSRHPGWAYVKSHRVNDFARDVRAAWQRVTGCAWAPPKDVPDEEDAPEGES